MDLSPGELRSAVRAGGCATPTDFVARAGTQANQALIFNPDHSMGADHGPVLGSIPMTDRQATPTWELSPSGYRVV